MKQIDQLNNKRTISKNGTDLLLRKYLLREVESRHLIPSFCRLSDLYISQKLISTPLYLDEKIDLDDIPPLYLNPLAILEIPELSRDYPFPLLTLSNALSGGCNIVIKGRIGAGKTTAISNLVIELLEKRCPVSELNNFLPLYIYASDLGLTNHEDDLESAIINYLVQRLDQCKYNDIVTILKNYRDNHQLLICVDGLDELPVKSFDNIVFSISSYLNKYPSIRMITTSGPFYTGKLLESGFLPFYLKPAAPEEIREIGRKFLSVLKTTSSNIEIDVFRGWLKNSEPADDFFTATLRLISYFTTPLKANSNILDPFVRYTTNGHLSTKEMGCIADELFMYPDNGISLTSLEKLIQVILAGRDNASPAPLARSILTSLIEKKVLRVNSDTTLSFSSAELFCRLLSQSKVHAVCTDASELLHSPVKNRITQLSDEISYLPSWLENVDKGYDPILLLSLDHLSTKPNRVNFRDSSIEKLGRMVIADNLALSIRYIASRILYYAHPQILFHILRKLSNTTNLDSLTLVILFTGKTHVDLSFDLLTEFCSSERIILKHLSILALARHPEMDRFGVIDSEMLGLGGKNTAILLSLAGVEGRQRLLDYAQSDNPNCRRNAVFGLHTYNENWSNNELLRLNRTDNTWMVRDAASQAIENHWQPYNSFIPSGMPTHENNPEMLRIIRENHAVSSPTGFHSENFSALIDTTDIQKQLLAIRYLFSKPTIESIKMLSKLVSSANPNRETALLALREIEYANLSLWG